MNSSSRRSPARNFSASLSKSSNSRSRIGMMWPGTFSRTSGFSRAALAALALGWRAYRFHDAESTKSRPGLSNYLARLGWPTHGSPPGRHRPSRSRSLRGGLAAGARRGRHRADRGAERRPERGHPPAVRAGARRPSRPTARSRACRSWSRTWPAPWRTRRTTRACASCATSASGPTPTRGSRRASARPASCSSARPTRPSSASCRRPSRGLRADAQPVEHRPLAGRLERRLRARRWRRAWCRSGTPTTAAARSASRRRATGWWA